MASQLIFTQNATAPDTPTTGRLKLYAKSDGFLYFKNDAGTETLISSTAAITDLTGDVTGTGPGSTATTVVSVGGALAAAIASATALANAATNNNTASTIVRRDASGNFSAGTITANLSGNATNFTGSLSGEVTGTQSTTVLSTSAVTSKLLTGFSSGAGTLTSSDSILSALGKLDGNDLLRALKSGDTFTGVVVMDNQQAIRFREDSANGTEFVGIRAPSALGASYTVQLPNAQAAGALTNDGSGNLSWVASSLAAFTTDDLTEGTTNLYFTNERAQDAVGTILTDSSTVDFTYNDVGNTITASVIQSAIDHGNLAGLADDDHTQYHTDARALTWLGTRSTSDLAEGSNLYFTDERAQDAVGSILVDSTNIDFTYNDAGNTITASIVPNSIVNGDIDPSAGIAYSKLALSNSIIDSDIAGAAAISLSKLASLTANRAVQTSGSGVLEVSTVTSTELGYLSGVTSGLQTQLNNKQPLDADLTALAALSSTGIIARTGAGTVATRTLTAGTGISIADGDGVAANPTISATLSGLDTDDLAEGTTNLYFTDERAQDAVGSILTDSTNIDFTYNDAGNTITASIVPASIVNADVSASAAIDGTKISPIFGSQNISTTGTVTGSTLFALGTGGAGYLELLEQSSAPATPTNATRLFVDSSNRLSWKGENGFVRTFDGTSNSADRIYTLPNASGTLAFRATSQVVNSNVSLSDGLADLIVLVDTAAARNITLPAPANNAGRRIVIKDYTGQGETNNITVIRAGSENIEGIAASRVLSANFGSWTFFTDGTNWFML